MPPRKEPCRNFQRGSCQYGDRCKFLHVTQQQPKPNNLFGFGSQSNATQQQQQKPNPFGFGVQSNSQARGFSDSGSKQNNGFKPFENKWTRSSSNTTGGSNVAQQPDNQPPASNHKCTDPESCRRQIAEDFKNEKPLWILTCYGHVKNGPCDIVGDISYEELRALAYDDAKRGLNVQSIVERERSLLNAKLLEFDGLLRNPNPFPPSITLDTKNSFTGASPNVSSLSAQANAPPSVSSFSQLGMRPAAPSNAMMQANHFQVGAQPSSVSGTNNLAFGNKGLFGSQPPAQPFGRSFPSFAENFSTTGTVAGQNTYSASGFMAPITNVTNNPSPIFSNGFNAPPSATAVSNANQNMINEMLKENGAGNNGIWSKEEWYPGEIPEQAPPDEFIR